MNSDSGLRNNESTSQLSKENVFNSVNTPHNRLPFPTVTQESSLPGGSQEPIVTNRIRVGSNTLSSQVTTQPRSSGRVLVSSLRKTIPVSSLIRGPDLRVEQRADPPTILASALEGAPPPNLGHDPSVTSETSVSASQSGLTTASAAVVVTAVAPTIITAAASDDSHDTYGFNTDELSAQATSPSDTTSSSTASPASLPTTTAAASTVSTTQTQLAPLLSTRTRITAAAPTVAERADLVLGMANAKVDEDDPYSFPHVPAAETAVDPYTFVLVSASQGEAAPTPDAAVHAGEATSLSVASAAATAPATTKQARAEAALERVRRVSVSEDAVDANMLVRTPTLAICSSSCSSPSTIAASTTQPHASGASLTLESSLDLRTVNADDIFASPADIAAAAAAKRKGKDAEAQSRIRSLHSRSVPEKAPLRRREVPAAVVAAKSNGATEGRVGEELGADMVLESLVDGNSDQSEGGAEKTTRISAGQGLRGEEMASDQSSSNNAKGVPHHPTSTSSSSSSSAMRSPPASTPTTRKGRRGITLASRRHLDSDDEADVVPLRAGTPALSSVLSRPPAIMTHNHTATLFPSVTQSPRQEIARPQQHTSFARAGARVSAGTSAGTGVDGSWKEDVRRRVAQLKQRFGARNSLLSGAADAEDDTGGDLWRDAAGDDMSSSVRAASIAPSSAVVSTSSLRRGVDENIADVAPVSKAGKKKAKAAAVGVVKRGREPRGRGIFDDSDDEPVPMPIGRGKGTADARRGGYIGLDTFEDVDAVFGSDELFAAAAGEDASFLGLGRGLGSGDDRPVTLHTQAGIPGTSGLLSPRVGADVGINIGVGSCIDATKSTCAVSADAQEVWMNIADDPPALSPHMLSGHADIHAMDLLSVSYDDPDGVSVGDGDGSEDAGMEDLSYVDADGVYHTGFSQALYGDGDSTSDGVYHGDGDLDTGTSTVGDGGVGGGYVDTWHSVEDGRWLPTDVEDRYLRDSMHIYEHNNLPNHTVRANAHSTLPHSGSSGPVSPYFPPLSPPHHATHTAIGVADMGSYTSARVDQHPLAATSASSAYTSSTVSRSLTQPPALAVSSRLTAHDSTLPTTGYPRLPLRFDREEAEAAVWAARCGGKLGAQELPVLPVAYDLLLEHSAQVLHAAWQPLHASTAVTVSEPASLIDAIAATTEDASTKSTEVTTVVDANYAPSSSGFTQAETSPSPSVMHVQMSMSPDAHVAGKRSRSYMLELLGATDSLASFTSGPSGQRNGSNSQQYKVAWRKRGGYGYVLPDTLPMRLEDRTEVTDEVATRCRESVEPHIVASLADKTADVFAITTMSSDVVPDTIASCPTPITITATSAASATTLSEASPHTVDTARDKVLDTQHISRAGIHQRSYDADWGMLSLAPAADIDIDAVSSMLYDTQSPPQSPLSPSSPRRHSPDMHALGDSSIDTTSSAKYAVMDASGEVTSSSYPPEIHAGENGSTFDTTAAIGMDTGHTYSTQDGACVQQDPIADVCTQALDSLCDVPVLDTLSPLTAADNLAEGQAARRFSSPSAVGTQARTHNPSLNVLSRENAAAPTATAQYSEMYASEEVCLTIDALLSAASNRATTSSASNIGSFSPVSARARHHSVPLSLLMDEFECLAARVEVEVALPLDMYALTAAHRQHFTHAMRANSLSSSSGDMQGNATAVAGHLCDHELNESSRNGVSVPTAEGLDVSPTSAAALATLVNVHTQEMLAAYMQHQGGTACPPLSRSPDGLRLHAAAVGSATTSSLPHVDELGIYLALRANLSDLIQAMLCPDSRRGAITPALAALEASVRCVASSARPSDMADNVEDVHHREPATQPELLTAHLLDWSIDACARVDTLVRATTCGDMSAADALGEYADSGVVSQLFMDGLDDDDTTTYHFAASALVYSIFLPFFAAHVPTLPAHPPRALPLLISYTATPSAATTIVTAQGEREVIALHNAARTDTHTHVPPSSYLHSFASMHECALLQTLRAAATHTPDHPARAGLHCPTPAARVEVGEDAYLAGLAFMFAHRAVTAAEIYEDHPQLQMLHTHDEAQRQAEVRVQSEGATEIDAFTEAEDKTQMVACDRDNPVLQALSVSLQYTHYLTVAGHVDPSHGVRMLSTANEVVCVSPPSASSLPQLHLGPLQWDCMPALDADHWCLPRQDTFTAVTTSFVTLPTTAALSEASVGAIASFPLSAADTRPLQARTVLLNTDMLHGRDMSGLPVAPWVNLVVGKDVPTTFLVQSQNHSAEDIARLVTDAFSTTADSRSDAAYVSLCAAMAANPLSCGPSDDTDAMICGEMSIQQPMSASDIPPAYGFAAALGDSVSRVVREWVRELLALVHWPSTATITGNSPIDSYAALHGPIAITLPDASSASAPTPPATMGAASHILPSLFAATSLPTSLYAQLQRVHRALIPALSGDVSAPPDTMPLSISHTALSNDAAHALIRLAPILCRYEPLSPLPPRLAASLRAQCPSPVFSRKRNTYAVAPLADTRCDSSSTSASSLPVFAPGNILPRTADTSLSDLYHNILCQLRMPSIAHAGNTRLERSIRSTALPGASLLSPAVVDEASARTSARGTELASNVAESSARSSTLCVLPQQFGYGDGQVAWSQHAESALQSFHAIACPVARAIDAYLSVDVIDLEAGDDTTKSSSTDTEQLLSLLPHDGHVLLPLPAIAAKCVRGQSTSTSSTSSPLLSFALFSLTIASAQRLSMWSALTSLAPDHNYTHVDAFMQPHARRHAAAGAIVSSYASEETDLTVTEVYQWCEQATKAQSMRTLPQDALLVPLTTELTSPPTALHTRIARANAALAANARGFWRLAATMLCDPSGTEIARYDHEHTYTAGNASGAMTEANDTDILIIEESQGIRTHTSRDGSVRAPAILPSPSSTATSHMPSTLTCSTTIATAITFTAMHPHPRRECCFDLPCKHLAATHTHAVTHLPGDKMSPSVASAPRPLSTQLPTSHSIERAITRAGLQPIPLCSADALAAAPLIAASEPPHWYSRTYALASRTAPLPLIELPLDSIDTTSPLPRHVATPLHRTSAVGDRVAMEDAAGTGSEHVSALVGSSRDSNALVEYNGGSSVATTTVRLTHDLYSLSALLCGDWPYRCSTTPNTYGLPLTLSASHTLCNPKCTDLLHTHTIDLVASLLPPRYRCGVYMELLCLHQHIAQSHTNHGAAQRPLGAVLRDGRDAHLLALPAVLAHTDIAAALTTQGGGRDTHATGVLPQILLSSGGAVATRVEAARVLSTYMTSNTCPITTTASHTAAKALNSNPSRSHQSLRLPSTGLFAGPLHSLTTPLASLPRDTMYCLAHPSLALLQPTHILRHVDCTHLVDHAPLPAPASIAGLRDSDSAAGDRHGSFDSPSQVQSFHDFVRKHTLQEPPSILPPLLQPFDLNELGHAADSATSTTDPSSSSTPASSSASSSPSPIVSRLIHRDIARLGQSLLLSSATMLRTLRTDVFAAPSAVVYPVPAPFPLSSHQHTHARTTSRRSVPLMRPLPVTAEGREALRASAAATRLALQLMPPVSTADPLAVHALLAIPGSSAQATPDGSNANTRVCNPAGEVIDRALPAPMWSDLIAETDAQYIRRIAIHSDSTAEHSHVPLRSTAIVHSISRDAVEATLRDGAVSSTAAWADVLPLLHHLAPSADAGVMGGPQPHTDALMQEAETDAQWLISKVLGVVTETMSSASSRPAPGWTRSSPAKASRPQHVSREESLRAVHMYLADALARGHKHVYVCASHRGKRVLPSDSMPIAALNEQALHQVAYVLRKSGTIPVFTSPYAQTPPVISASLTSSVDLLDRNDTRLPGVLSLARSRTAAQHRERLHRHTVTSRTRLAAAVPEPSADVDGEADRGLAEASIVDSGDVCSPTNRPRIPDCEAVVMSDISPREHTAEVHVLPADVKAEQSATDLIPPAVEPPATPPHRPHPQPSQQSTPPSTAFPHESSRLSPATPQLTAFAPLRDTSPRHHTVEVPLVLVQPHAPLSDIFEQSSREADTSVEEDVNANMLAALPIELSMPGPHSANNSPQRDVEAVSDACVSIHSAQLPHNAGQSTRKRANSGVDASMDGDGANTTADEELNRVMSTPPRKKMRVEPSSPPQVAHNSQSGTSTMHGAETERTEDAVTVTASDMDMVVHDRGDHRSPTTDTTHSPVLAVVEACALGSADILTDIPTRTKPAHTSPAVANTTAHATVTQQAEGSLVSTFSSAPASTSHASLPSHAEHRPIPDVVTIVTTPPHLAGTIPPSVLPSCDTAKSPIVPCRSDALSPSSPHSAPSPSRERVCDSGDTNNNWSEPSRSNELHDIITLPPAPTSLLPPTPAYAAYSATPADAAVALHAPTPTHYALPSPSPRNYIDYSRDPRRRPRATVNGAMSAPTPTSVVLDTPLERAFAPTMSLVEAARIGSSRAQEIESDNWNAHARTSHATDTYNPPASLHQSAHTPTHSSPLSADPRSSSSSTITRAPASVPHRRRSPPRSPAPQLQVDEDLLDSVTALFACDASADNSARGGGRSAGGDGRGLSLADLSELDLHFNGAIVAEEAMDVTAATCIVDINGANAPAYAPPTAHTRVSMLTCAASGESNQFLRGNLFNLTCTTLTDEDARVAWTKCAAAFAAQPTPTPIRIWTVMLPATHTRALHAVDEALQQLLASTCVSLYTHYGHVLADNELVRNVRYDEALVSATTAMMRTHAARLTPNELRQLQSHSGAETRRFGYSCGYARPYGFHGDDSAANDVDDIADEGEASLALLSARAQWQEEEWQRGEMELTALRLLQSAKPSSTHNHTRDTASATPHNSHRAPSASDRVREGFGWTGVARGLVVGALPMHRVSPASLHTATVCVFSAVCDMQSMLTTHANEATRGSESGTEGVDETDAVLPCGCVHTCVCDVREEYIEACHLLDALLALYAAAVLLHAFVDAGGEYAALLYDGMRRADAESSNPHTIPDSNGLNAFKRYTQASNAAAPQTPQGSGTLHTPSVDDVPAFFDMTAGVLLRRQLEALVAEATARAPEYIGHEIDDNEQKGGKSIKARGAGRKRKAAAPRHQSSSSANASKTFATASDTPSVSGAPPTAAAAATRSLLMHCSEALNHWACAHEHHRRLLHRVFAEISATASVRAQSSPNMTTASALAPATAAVETPTPLESVVEAAYTSANDPRASLFVSLPLFIPTPSLAHVPAVSLRVHHHHVSAHPKLLFLANAVNTMLAQAQMGLLRDYNLTTGERLPQQNTAGGSNGVACDSTRLICPMSRSAAVPLGGVLPSGLLIVAADHLLLPLARALTALTAAQHQEYTQALRKHRNDPHAGVSTRVAGVNSEVFTVLDVATVRLLIERGEVGTNDVAGAPQQPISAPGLSSEPNTTSSSSSPCTAVWPRMRSSSLSLGSIFATPATIAPASLLTLDAAPWTAVRRVVVLHAGADALSSDETAVSFAKASCAATAAKKLLDSVVPDGVTTSFTPFTRITHTHASQANKRAFSHTNASTTSHKSHRRVEGEGIVAPPVCPTLLSELVSQRAGLDVLVTDVYGDFDATGRTLWGMAEEEGDCKEEQEQEEEKVEATKDEAEFAERLQERERERDERNEMTRARLASERITRAQEAEERRLQAVTAHTNSLVSLLHATPPANTASTATTCTCRTPACTCVWLCSAAMLTSLHAVAGLAHMDRTDRRLVQGFSTPIANGEANTSDGTAMDEHIHAHSDANAREGENSEASQAGTSAAASAPISSRRQRSAGPLLQVRTPVPTVLAPPTTATASGTAGSKSSDVPAPVSLRNSAGVCTALALALHTPVPTPTLSFDSLATDTSSLLAALTQLTPASPFIPADSLSALPSHARMPLVYRDMNALRVQALRHHTDTLLLALVHHHNARRRVELPVLRPPRLSAAVDNGVVARNEENSNILTSIASSKDPISLASLPLTTLCCSLHFYSLFAHLGDHLCHGPLLFFPIQLPVEDVVLDEHCAIVIRSLSHFLDVVYVPSTGTGTATAPPDAALASMLGSLDYSTPSAHDASTPARGGSGGAAGGLYSSRTRALTQARSSGLLIRPTGRLPAFLASLRRLSLRYECCHVFLLDDISADHPALAAQGIFGNADSVPLMSYFPCADGFPATHRAHQLPLSRHVAANIPYLPSADAHAPLLPSLASRARHPMRRCPVTLTDILASPAYHDLQQALTPTLDTPIIATSSSGSASAPRGASLPRHMHVEMRVLSRATDVFPALTSVLATRVLDIAADGSHYWHSPKFQRYCCVGTAESQRGGDTHVDGNCTGPNDTSQSGTTGEESVIAVNGDETIVEVASTTSSDTEVPTPFTVSTYLSRPWLDAAVRDNAASGSMGTLAAFLSALPAFNAHSAMLALTMHSDVLPRIAAAVKLIPRDIPQEDMQPTSEAMQEGSAGVNALRALLPWMNQVQLRALVATMTARYAIPPPAAHSRVTAQVSHTSAFASRSVPLHGAPAPHDTHYTPAHSGSVYRDDAPSGYAVPHAQQHVPASIPHSAYPYAHGDAPPFAHNNGPRAQHAPQHGLPPPQTPMPTFATAPAHPKWALTPSSQAVLPHMMHVERAAPLSDLHHHPSHTPAPHLRVQNQHSQAPSNYHTRPASAVPPLTPTLPLPFSAQPASWDGMGPTLRFGGERSSGNGNGGASGSYGVWSGTSKRENVPPQTPTLQLHQWPPHDEASAYAQEHAGHWSIGAPDAVDGSNGTYRDADVHLPPKRAKVASHVPPPPPGGREVNSTFASLADTHCGTSGIREGTEWNPGLGGGVAEWYAAHRPNHVVGAPHWQEGRIGDSDPGTTTAYGRSAWGDAHGAQSASNKVAYADAYTYTGQGTPAYASGPLQDYSHNKAEQQGFYPTPITHYHPDHAHVVDTPVVTDAVRQREVYMRRQREFRKQTFH